jgi:serine/threonine protein kinase/Tol biopolymer transport system component
LDIKPGTRLGLYETLSPLGKGGMGEVWCARDTRLDRQVAIKVLPEPLARDEDRVLRFQREARLLASLNHTNIAQIYGFEESNGSKYLVLEYVAGETLGARLKGGPLATDEALEICKQIADALEAAHEKGIIHRDLKPSNVMIRPDGSVKVLDFGLGKAVAEDSSMADSGTITVDYTRAGVVLGTVPYMSPEQARGRPVDRRTDIWSLGCVLFECLSGKRTFDGATTTELLAQIVSEQPDFSRLAPDTGLFLTRLIRRCLEKDPKRRLRDVGEVRIAIEEFQAHAETTLVDGPPPSTERSLPFVRLLPWALAAVLGIALGYSLWPRERPMVSPARAVSRWTILLPDKARVDFGGTGGKFDYSRTVAVSPNGERIVYAMQSLSDRSELYLREIEEFQVRPIPGTTNGRGPFFSPDGAWLGFLSDTMLQKVKLTGGSPQKICDVNSASFDASWAPDGESIVFGTDAGLWRVSSNGGTPEQLTSPRSDEGELAHHFPHVASDGRHVLFTVVTTKGAHLAQLALENRTWKTIIRDAAQGALLHNGHVVFARRGELMVAPFAAKTGKIAGPAVSVLQNVHTLTGLGGIVVTQFDVAATGILTYVPATTATVDQLLWVDRSGNETVITSGPGTWVHPRLSPDGERISVDIHSPDGERDVYIYELLRDQLNRLTHEGITWESEWSPDGKRLAVMSGRVAGRRSLFLVRTDFSGPPELLHPGDHSIPTSWSPDGMSLLFYDYAEGGIMSVSPQHDRTPKLVVGSSANERFPRLSPDGKWMAFVADESARRQVFVQSYPGLGPRHKISIEGGGEPVWSRDGRKLFFREADQAFFVSVEYEPAFACSPPTKLFSGQYDAALIGHQHYDVSLDGEKFLMIKHGKPVGPNEVRVVLNWFDELERRVP